MVHLGEPLEVANRYLEINFDSAGPAWKRVRATGPAWR